MSMVGPILREIKEVFGANWQPLPSEAQFGEGRLWRKVEGEKPYEEYFNGVKFAPEELKTTLMKTAGVLTAGPYLLMAGTIYHLFKGAMEGKQKVADLKATWEEVKEQQDAPKDFKTFMRQNQQEFNGAISKLGTAAKHFVVLIPFMVQPNPFSIIGSHSGMGFYAWLGFSVYCAYNPRYPKVVLNDVENWLGGEKLLSPILGWKPIEKQIDSAQQEKVEEKIDSPEMKYGEEEEVPLEKNKPQQDKKED